MTILPTLQKQDNSEILVRWASNALVATVWISSILFGLYILAFYAAALPDDDMARWNTVLPGLYDAERPAATVGIGLHFAAGGIILILGSIQLIEGIRNRYPLFHHWVGRIYVVASLLTAAGGLIYCGQWDGGRYRHGYRLWPIWLSHVDFVC